MSLTILSIIRFKLRRTLDIAGRQTSYIHGRGSKKEREREGRAEKWQHEGSLLGRTCQ